MTSEEGGATQNVGEWTKLGLGLTTFMSGDEEKTCFSSYRKLGQEVGGYVTSSGNFITAVVVSEEIHRKVTVAIYELFVSLGWHK